MGLIAYISLGSNLNNPLQQIKTALLALKQIPQTTLVAVSSLYQTAPVGYEPQPDFINAVAALETELLAEQLLSALHAIEYSQARIRTEEKNRPRTLDLDILLYGNQTLKSPNLVIPHPRLKERAFVLVPLNEIAPNLQLMPNVLVQQLLAALPEEQLNTVKLFSVSLCSGQK